MSAVPEFGKTMGSAGIAGAPEGAAPADEDAAPAEEDAECRLQVSMVRSGFGSGVWTSGNPSGNSPPQ